MDEPPHHPVETPPYRLVPPGDTLGVRHVELALRDLPFPATRDEILARAGHWRVPVTGNHFHTMAEFLADVPGRRRFRGPGDVAKAIGKAHPELKD